MRTIPQVARIKSPQRLPALRQGYGGQAENAEVQTLSLWASDTDALQNSCSFVSVCGWSSVHSGGL